MAYRAIEAFRHHYAAEPTHLVRAPGRVNLIGEHVDYHDLPVLPVATERAVWIAFRRRGDGTVCFASSQEGLDPVEFGLSPAISPAPSSHWSNYVRAAAQSVCDLQGCRLGIDAMVSSDLPAAAGLSSSSALVVGTALALLHANEVVVDPIALASQMAEAERYTGTRGGGMDQAACLLGEKRKALLLDFAPLRAQSVPIPESFRFLVAYSLETAEKSGAVQAEYNSRRRQGGEALKALRMALGRPELSFVDAVREVSDPLERIRGRVSEIVLDRARHVLSEAARVRLAVEAMTNEDIDGLGRLMNESHASLASDYGVSTAALDEIVGIARDAGAHGARLTGAGFGGCAVVLTDVEGFDGVLDALRGRFYEPRGIDTDARLVLFSVRPASGAEVLPVR